MAAALVAEAHGEVLRLIGEMTKIHYTGLQQAAKGLRKPLSTCAQRALRQPDTAAAVNRHITSGSVRELVLTVQRELKDWHDADTTIDGGESRCLIDFGSGGVVDELGATTSSEEGIVHTFLDYEYNDVIGCFLLGLGSGSKNESDGDGCEGKDGHVDRESAPSNRERDAIFIKSVWDLDGCGARLSCTATRVRARAARTAALPMSTASARTA